MSNIPQDIPPVSPLASEQTDGGNKTNTASREEAALARFRRDNATTANLTAQEAAANSPVQQSITGAPGVNAPAVEVKVEGDTGIINTIKDSLMAIPGGVAGAVNEVADLAYSTGDFVQEVATKGWSASSFDEKDSPLRLPEYEAETGVGKVVKGITQFAAGFLGVGKFMKAGKILAGASPFMRASAQGAAADFLTMDAHEERLSNLVESFPSLRNPITEFLSTDKDDDVVTGRFKGALEGIGLGVAMEGLLHGLRSLKALRQGNTPPEAPAAATPGTTPPAAAAEAPAPIPGRNAASLPASQIKQIIDKAATQEEAVTGVLYNVNLNRTVFSSPQGSHVLADVSQQLAERSLKAAGPQGHEKLFTEAVEDLEASGFKAIKALAETDGSAESLNAVKLKLLQMRNISVMCTTEADRLALLMNEGRASWLDKTRFVMLSDNLQQLDLAIANMRTEAGRTLSSLNKEVNEQSAKAMLGDDFLTKFTGTGRMTEEEAQQWLKRNGYDATDIDKLARDVTMTGDAKSAAKLMREYKKAGSWKDIIMELRINSLLSGPLTHIYNVMSNSAKTLIMPQEYIIGGLLTGNKESIRHGMMLNSALHSHIGDSFRMMGKALKNNQAILDSAQGTLEAGMSHQISYERCRDFFLKRNPQGELSPLQETLARATGWMGTVINLPSRALIGGDELFKQLNFRTDLQVRLQEEALQKGITKADDIAAYVAENFNKAFDEGGAVVKGELTADSLAYAQRATWTTALQPNSMGYGIQQAAQNSHLIRHVIPFVRTPVNLLRDFWAHTPLAPFHKEFREAFAKGGEERARVLGQIATGAITGLMGFTLAQRGLITGAMPEDPQLRAQLEATGFQAYSYKVNGSYISYSRMDPMGLFLAGAADLHTYLSRGENLTDKEQNKAVTMFLSSFVHNLSSKTYLQGITETVNFINDPERRGTSYTGRFASTLIPYSGALRFARKLEDPHMREMRDFSDYILNTVPGFSKDLPARRSWIDGQPQDYNILIGKDVNDPVKDEMVRLGKAIHAGPDKVLKGVELSGRQFERLNELHGTLKIQGKTMHQTLASLMDSPGYDKDRQKFGDAPDGLDNPRARVVDKVIDKYRRYAEATLLHEDAELLSSIRKQYASKALAKRGAYTRNSMDAVQNLLR